MDLFDFWKYETIKKKKKKLVPFIKLFKISKTNELNDNLIFEASWSSLHLKLSESIDYNYYDNWKVIA